MMCIACEQDAMWVAYLQRKGLITPDGYLVEQPPSVFAAEPLEPAPVAAEVKEETPPETPEKSKFSGDDPAA
ncbi:MAG TPA: hypothetical protein VJX48_04240 [Xanthobacteraceae bacterium]|nr:hypothetical protein [Xanthobacteraceae bacterium]